MKDFTLQELVKINDDINRLHKVISDHECHNFLYRNYDCYRELFGAAVSAIGLLHNKATEEV